jgi:hypothetical protein
MGNDESTPQTGLSRRDLLRRGAVVGGTLVWAVPAMEVLSLTSAHATSPSGGGGGPQNPQPQGGGGGGKH